MWTPLVSVLDTPKGRKICMSYIPNTPEDQQTILDKLGISSLEAY